MPQPIASCANLVPRLIRAKYRRAFPEPYSSFANDEKLPLHCGDGFRILLKRVEIHAGDEILDHVDGFQDVAEREAGVLRRQGLLPALRDAVPAPLACACPTDRHAFPGFR